MNPLQLYLLFVKIGLFTFGGGYAMIPLFQDELVIRHAFLSPDEFANLVALAQMTPGPVGLNAATYIGYQQAGFAGAAAGTLGVVTPSLILVSLAAYFFTAWKNNCYWKSALTGIRPATIGLIASAVLFFAGTSVFTAQIDVLWTGKAAEFGLCWQGAVIFLLNLIAVKQFKCGIIPAMAGSAVLAYFLFLFQ